MVTNQEYPKDATFTKDYNGMNTSQIDPPDDEPPSLKIQSMEENENQNPQYHTHDQNHVSSLPGKPDIDDQGFFRMAPGFESEAQDRIDDPDNFSSQYVSPVSESRHAREFEGFEQRPKDPSLAVSNSLEEPLEANRYIGTTQQDKQVVSHDLERQNVVPSQLSSNGTSDEKFPYSDEKKIGTENEGVADPNDLKEEFWEEPANSDVIGSIDTSHTRPKEYEDSPSAYPFSPSAMESRGHQSPAMRGAHEILKRNRRRRAEA